MYRLATRGVVRLSDNLTITRDMPEWEEYRGWLKSGGVPDAEVPPAEVPLDLDSRKALKRLEIEQHRDVACYADVAVLGRVWQADPRSQSLLATAILLSQAGVYTPTVWRTADNADVPVTLHTLVLIAGTIAAQTQAAYVDSWARKGSVNAAQTVEEVDAA